MAGQLNPNIRTVDVGTRELRTVTIYPLSMADQIKVLDAIKGGMGALAGPEAQSSNAIALEAMSNILRDNIENILTYITDESNRITMAELTNEQLSEIVTIVYEVNFEKALGNFKGLFDKMKAAFQPTRPSQPSASGTDTDSRTSTSDTPGKED